MRIYSLVCWPIIWYIRALSTQGKRDSSELGEYPQHHGHPAQRVTLMLPTDSNTTILLRTTTQSEALHKQLYRASNLKPNPICKRKKIIDRKQSVVPTNSS